jgi:hypothetical protein
MRTLEKELRVQGRTLKQLKREGMVALYALHGGSGLLYGYELVQVQVRLAEKILGRSFPEREVYPKSESWGRLGWSFGANGRKEADTCFLERCERAAADPKQTDLGPSEG